ncbi:hypothetical protein M0802_016214 [Mischocyttarus mexicanus]|nr:hypothetical protein M0802_016214 [Mischocyttarus mexicanus]
MFDAKVFLLAMVIPVFGTFVVSGIQTWGSTIGQNEIRERSIEENVEKGPLPNLTIGLVVPHTNFNAREYTKTINRVVSNLRKGHAGRNKGQGRLTFFDKYVFTPHQVKNTMLRLTPSPTGNFINGLFSTRF